MTIDKLPFKLDEQYELNEFDLEFVEDLGKLVKYRYEGKKLSIFLGLEVKQINLYYNADYLRVVEFHLKIDNVSEIAFKWAYMEYIDES